MEDNTLPPRILRVGLPHLKKRPKRDAEILERRDIITGGVTQILMDLTVQIPIIGIGAGAREKRIGRDQDPGRERTGIGRRSIKTRIEKRRRKVRRRTEIVLTTKKYKVRFLKCL